MSGWIRKKTEEKQTVDLIYQRFLKRYPLSFRGDKTAFTMPTVVSSKEMKTCATALVDALQEVHGDDWCTEERYYEGEVTLMASVLGFLSEWYTEDGVYNLSDVAYILGHLHVSDDRKLSWYHIQMDELFHGLKLADLFEQGVDKDGYADEHRAYLNCYAYDVRTKWPSNRIRVSDGIRAGEIHNRHLGMAKVSDPTLFLFYNQYQIFEHGRLCIATALKTLAEPLCQVEGMNVTGYWTRGEERTARLCSEAWNEQGYDVPEGHVPNTLEIMLRQAIIDSAAAAHFDNSLLDQYAILLDEQKKRLEVDRELY